MSNLDLKVHLRDGDALITRARANLVAMFLDDPKATHFLFIDADIGFRPERVFRLIECGADVVAGCYPIKRVNWDKAKRAIEARRIDLPAAALDYVLEVEDPDRIVVVNGFTRVRYAGTGFLMIRRHVLEAMCRHPAYANLQFFREHSHDTLAASQNRFALFECMSAQAVPVTRSEAIERRRVNQKGKSYVRYCSLCVGSSEPALSPVHRRPPRHHPVASVDRQEGEHGARQPHQLLHGTVARQPRQRHQQPARWHCQRRAGAAGRQHRHHLAVEAAR